MLLVFIQSWADRVTSKYLDPAQGPYAWVADRAIPAASLPPGARRAAGLGDPGDGAHAGEGGRGLWGVQASD